MKIKKRYLEGIKNTSHTQKLCVGFKSKVFSLYALK